MSNERMIDAPEDVGAMIRAARKARSLTQRELSEAAGVGLRFVIDVERGKQTSQIGKVLHLLRVLGVQLYAHDGFKDRNPAGSKNCT
ncbi:MAG TPA: helix-turn-helix transcriptional regulator [Hyphomicrobium sp.]|nr:helix-turn-helix transcriptional regulator [Hyphomicrobium sp.]